jgi:hypothetical protein
VWASIRINVKRMNFKFLFLSIRSISLVEIRMFLLFSGRTRSSKISFLGSGIELKTPQCNSWSQVQFGLGFGYYWFPVLFLEQICTGRRILVSSDLTILNSILNSILNFILTWTKSKFFLNREMGSL